MDLSNLSLPEMYQLQKDLSAEIEQRKVSDKKNLIAELQNLAAAKGFSLQDVLGGALSTKAAKSTGIAQFRNPADASQTWTGRGRKPQWVQDWLQAGKPLDGLRI
ncbi:H-NS histone family protein [Chitinolyticbacter meiyuanensis]|uniref:H-NS histone family protein n=1 Tax=Chitinolyticbacter meiyuanensis TaxID=682798 RepID=UPI0011E6073C|nr:H-NS histone family protein [Chitinolyticbacter meiyuanensis]